MNKKEYLLTKLIEESAEIIQATTKIKTFGEESVAPYSGVEHTNIDQLVIEISDLLAVVKELEVEGVIKVFDDNLEDRISAKRQKLEKYYKIHKNIFNLE